MYSRKVKKQQCVCMTHKRVIWLSRMQSRSTTFVCCVGSLERCEVVVFCSVLLCRTALSGCVVQCWDLLRYVTWCYVLLCCMQLCWVCVCTVMWVRIVLRTVVLCYVVFLTQSSVESCAGSFFGGIFLCCVVYCHFEVHCCDASCIVALCLSGLCPIMSH